MTKCIIYNGIKVKRNDNKNERDARDLAIRLVEKHLARANRVKEIIWFSDYKWAESV